MPSEGAGFAPSLRFCFFEEKSMDNSMASGQSDFRKTLKRGCHKTLTFLGVPANDILVFFGILLLLLNLAPMVTVLLDTFTVHMMEYVPLGEGELASGSLTGYHYYEVFASPTAVGNFYRPLANSLLTSVLACAFAILFGGGVAYLITRTNMPFKKFISSVFIFPYIMPQWTLALFWKNLFISTACQGGYIGEFQHLTGLAAPSWFVYGAFPIALVLGLHYAPFAYILIGGVLRNMDSNLEEAATILNVPKWKIFTHVTVPILKPALLSTILLVFSSAMSAYPVAVTLGTPVSYYVLATKMQTMIQGQGTQIGQGNIISLVLIVIGVVILLVNQANTSGRKQFTTVSGKSGQISKANLGKANKWVVASILLVLVLFVCVGPLVSFAIESFLPNSGDYSAGFTTRWWTSTSEIRNGIPGLLYYRDMWVALRGSILLSLACALLAGTSGLLIGYAVSKYRKAKAAQFVNGLAFLPYLLPSISLSAVFLTLALRLKWLYALPFLLCVIVGTLKYIPFSSRSSLSAMMQLSGEIEEAALIQNVPWWKRMTRVIFPIQKSAFLSGYLLPFISCMRELSLFVFIAPTGLILTTLMFQLNETGCSAFENGANLILVLVILLFNFLANKLTGASLDKGIGG